MDINLLRVVITVAAMAAFLAIAWWAYSPSRRKRLDAEAERILHETEA